VGEVKILYISKVTMGNIDEFTQNLTVSIVSKV